MTRGVVIPLLFMLATGAAAQMHGSAPDSAVLNTWNAVLNGSPQEFLITLESGCAEQIMQECTEYLHLMQTMSYENLGMIFAELRLEAAPGEIEFWDNTAVLEMILSAPGQVYILEKSILEIDGLQCDNSTGIVFISLDISGIGNVSLEIPVISTTAGWQVTGIDPIVSSVLESIITR
ncbi:MAG: hypothetical protein K8R76_10595 [Candidatus Aegiribacteria sp.]|nr:hypothetical protein [Candidatus Aegiribacteria sp.]